VLLTILGTSQSYMYSTKINTPCCFLCSDFVKFLTGFLPTQYAETDGIPLFARRSLSCNASQS